MNRNNALANRFREIMLHGIWVANTNYKAQLSTLSYLHANTISNGLNSILLLAQHIHYYIVGINQVLQGGSLDIKDTYSFDFPPIDSQVAWEGFLAQFWIDSEEFATLIEQLPEGKLDEVFIDEKYGTYQRNIDGMIEHCYYHLGQIVMIRKIIEQKD